MAICNRSMVSKTAKVRPSRSRSVAVNARRTVSKSVDSMWYVIVANDIIGDLHRTAPPYCFARAGRARGLEPEGYGSSVTGDGKGRARIASHCLTVGGAARLMKRILTPAAINAIDHGQLIMDKCAQLGASQVILWSKMGEEAARNR